MEVFHKKEIIAAGLLFFLFALIEACASKSVSTPAITPKAFAPSVSNMPEDQPWQKDWTQVVKGAQREGIVVVYSSVGGDMRVVLSGAFKERYGITVEYLAARGPELAAKILSEQRAGIYYPDVLIGAGLPAIAQLKPAGAYDNLESALILPEVIDPKYWFNNRFPWVDSEHYVMTFLAYPSVPIHINTNFVKPEEIQSYDDLLNPKWKQKIIMLSPAKAGSGNMGVWALRTIRGESFLRELVKQEPFLLEDNRIIAEWLARGKYPVGMFIGTEAIVEMQKAGAPLEFVTPREGTHLAAGSGYLSLPKKAPHPNASKLFINWLLSKEGQTVYVKNSGVQSAREDIPIEFTDPAFQRKPDKKYYEFVSEEELLGGENRIRFALDIFGHLIPK